MRGNVTRKALGAILVLVCLAAVASAEVKLAGVLGDHMVLQRDVAVPIWGWAEPGESVSVSLGDQTKTATADAGGKWSVRLEALQAGGPYTLKVQGKDKALQCSDVMVGEVWLCSGQSNMEMSVGGVKDRAAEVAAARYPAIRMYFIKHIPAKEPQSQRDGQWVVCSPASVSGFSAAGYFFGRELHKQLGVPVGLINSSWGGTPIQTWTSIKAHEAVPELRGMAADLERQAASYDPDKAKAEYEKQLARWEKGAAQAKAAGKAYRAGRPQPPQDPRLSPWAPAALYNGMIAPLAPYALRGAIWYQGESNAGQAALYGIQLKTMIANWRADWGQGDFPFLSVQLPNFMAPQSQPSESVGGWPLVREQFLKTLDTVKNTGMAVTIDVGEERDIHPHDKQAVGKRLAQWALAKTYGKDVLACGPLYKSMHVEGGTIVLEFDYAEGGLAARDGDKLKGFAIAGPDKIFVWADARIVGNTVVVSSPKVSAPAAVRYAWANNPDCNLINKAGLPASPFRTDDWK
ncbi:MAG: sialate O-acetylesterase [Thermoguttaceae bacterium]